jgi:sugar lactone lactonase YvrE
MTVRKLLTAAVAAMALLIALPPASLARKGDVYVADGDAPVIWKFARDGGEAAELASGGLLGAPVGMALDRDGTLLVASQLHDDEILRVDRHTGAISSVVSKVFPFDVAPGADGMLYVTSLGRLLRVDPRTRNVEQVSADPAISGATGLALTRAGTAYVADSDTSTIQAIDLRDGSLGRALSDPLLDGPAGLALSADERFLYAAGSGSDNIVRFNTRTGDANEVVALGDAQAVSLFPDASFLVSESDLIPHAILSRVGPSGTPVEVFSDDSELDFPHESVIEPKRCRGRFPTVVGTTGRDKLKGSRFADVISTLGGNDKVNAGNGKDIVCGGKGKDKLKGGKGKDKLKGGPGKDKEIQ